MCDAGQPRDVARGTKFHLPATPLELQLAVSKFAFCCKVILFLAQESSQLSLVGFNNALQSPCAQPRAKRLRKNFEFNSGVNHRGSLLQNDKTRLTSDGCMAGPCSNLPEKLRSMDKTSVLSSGSSHF